METIIMSGKLRDRDKQNCEGFHKEKSKSPLRSEDRSPGAKSPDSRNNSSSNASGSAYCPSSSPGSRSSPTGGGGGKTKNIGVGANLNGSRQLRLNNSNNNNNNPKSNGLGIGVARTTPVPNHHSPITGSLLPELIQQSQLGRSSSGGGGVAMVVGGSGSSTSPGLPVAGGVGASGPGGATNPADASPSPNKIVSQNLNGTLAVTGVPTNESELQLYRVLQRANLLSYFDVMIELGGDDVQQLCDAGEEEFLEIMALVGMASKPLHVRRLQKSLQEWMTQPNLFQIPILNPHLPSSFGPHLPSLPARESLDGAAPAASPQMPVRPIPYHSGVAAAAAAAAAAATATAGQFMNPTELMKNLQSKLCSLRGTSGSETHGSDSSSPVGNLVPTPVISLSSSFTSGQSSGAQVSGTGSSSHSGGSTNGGGSGSSVMEQLIPSHFLEQRIRTRSEASSPASSTESHQLDSRTSLSPIPFLQEHEVQRLSEAAVSVISGLPASMMEPRLSAKKKMCAEFETVMRIPENDPGKMDVVRKYAAIYGRHDCKRKVQKPLTLHELTVNEAAAQLCARLPALLTRRDELFPLARQVVKDAGLPYVSITSTMSISMLPKTIKHDDPLRNPTFNNNNGSMSNPYGEAVKRAKLRDSKSGDLHDMRSPLSNDNESNSEDSYPNDSASNQIRLGCGKRQDFFSPFDKSSSRNSGALDMSSSSDEPNDLSIGKNLSPNKCNLSSSSDVRNSLRSIKSEPVS